MRRRSASSSHSRRSSPSSDDARPRVGRYRRVSSLISVVLPEPFSPTRASDSPGADVQIHVAEHRRLGAGIGKSHVLEADAVLRTRPAPSCRSARLDRRIQVLVERREVKIVLVHAADRGEARRDRRLALAEEHHVHRHLAERDARGDRRERDPGVGAIERRGRDEAEQEAPAVAADGEVAVLAVELAEYVAVAREEERPDAEQLDLLGVVFARQHGLEVELHARLGRAPEEEAERHAGKPRFGDEGGQPCRAPARRRPRARTARAGCRSSRAKCRSAPARRSA